MAGCKKDYLNLQPTDQQTKENFYQNKGPISTGH
jgi:hypothetical protein